MHWLGYSLNLKYLRSSMVYRVFIFHLMTLMAWTHCCGLNIKENYAALCLECNVWVCVCGHAFVTDDNAWLLQIDHLWRRRRFSWSFWRFAAVSIRRPPCNLDLQLGRSLDKSVQDSGVILKSFRSRFMTSLKRSRGRPVWRLPSSRTPCISSRGILWFGIRLTCPAQRRRINLSLDDNGPEPVVLAG